METHRFFRAAIMAGFVLLGPISGASAGIFLIEEHPLWNPSQLTYNRSIPNNSGFDYAPLTFSGLLDTTAYQVSNVLVSWQGASGVSFEGETSASGLLTDTVTSTIVTPAPAELNCQLVFAPPECASYPRVETVVESQVSHYVEVVDRASLNLTLAPVPVLQVDPFTGLTSTYPVFEDYQLTMSREVWVDDILLVSVTEAVSAPNEAFGRFRCAGNSENATCEARVRLAEMDPNSYQTPGVSYTISAAPTLSEIFSQEPQGQVTGYFPQPFSASFSFVVPEPGTALLVGLGLIGLGVRRRVS